MKSFLLTVISALATILAFWFWQLRIPFIFGVEAKEYVAFLFPFSALVIAGVLFGFAAMFSTRWEFAYGGGLAGIAGSFLLLPATNLVLGTLVFALLLTAFAIHRVRNEYEVSSGFSLSKNMKAGVPMFFTAASLIISLFFLQALSPAQAVSSFLPRSALEFILEKITQSEELRSFLGVPIIRPDDTVDDFLLRLVEGQIRTQGTNPSEATQRELLRLVAGERAELANYYGIRVEGDERFADVFVRAVTNYTESLLGPYKQYLPYASAAAFFLAFKTLTLPLYYLSLFLAFLLIKVLRFARILKTEIKEIEVERLTL